MNGDLEDGFLAGKMLCLIVGGEGNFDVALFTLVHTYHLLFKAGDKGVGTDLEGVVFGGTAFKLLIAEEACKIDNGAVALLNGTINAYSASLSFKPVIDFLFDVFIRNSILNSFNFYTLVLTEFNGGAGNDFGGEINAVLLGNGSEMDLGLELGNDVMLCKSIGICMLNECIEFIIPKYVLAVGLFDDLTRSLPLTEAGNLITGCKTAICALESTDIIFTADVKLKAYLTVFGMS